MEYSWRGNSELAYDLRGDLIGERFWPKQREREEATRLPKAMGGLLWRFLFLQSRQYVIPFTIRPKFVKAVAYYRLGRTPRYHFGILRVLVCGTRKLGLLIP